MHSRKPVYNLGELLEKAKDFDIQAIFKRGSFQNIPLSFDSAYLLGVYSLTPYRPQLKQVFNQDPELICRQSLAALCANHNRATYNHKVDGKYLASEQIAGICAAIMDYDIGLSEKGFLNPKVPYAIDNCGMGGDIRVTPNVSSVSALIASASGIPMCKHGSPSNADKGHHGSSDFIANLAFGMKDFTELINISREKMERTLERFNFAYTEALDEGYKSIHRQTHEYGRIPHMNDIVGPITNPLNPLIATKKIIGINQLIDPELISQTYMILNERGVTNLQDGIFVRGFVFEDRVGPLADDGMDELSTMVGGTLVSRLKNGKIENYNVYASDFGLDPAEYRDIMPPIDPQTGKYCKGQFSYKILQNKQFGPARDLILANAALIEHLANGTSLKDAYLKMQKVLDEGLPYENMLRVREFLKD